MKEGIGFDFQNETKYYREPYSAGAIERQKKIELLKGKVADKLIPLPEPDKANGPPIWQTINKRRSIRQFVRKPVSLQALSQLLWAAQGISLKSGDFYWRTTPSAGALYPIETYISVKEVESLVPGLYHYLPESQALRMKYEGDFSELLAEAALNQDFLVEASLIFLWTAVFDRTRWKYGDRGFRYIYLDAGHIAQNAALASVSLGLGTCPIAAFFDDEINNLLGINSRQESIIYLEAVGWPG
ncbi:MAG: SagB/ThcOx family dehydrogenase [Candidatus Aminicenantes bacterium]|jgi:Nitroreductase|nr:SagB/ThcOx family dehydrogenase [Candidatus Aminicenantes bacterium]